MSNEFSNSIVISESGGNAGNVRAVNFALNTLIQIPEFQDMLRIATSDRQLIITTDLVGFGGSLYNHNTNTIHLDLLEIANLEYLVGNGNNLQRASIQEVIIHEVQHAIQFEQDWRFQLAAQDIPIVSDLVQSWITDSLEADAVNITNELREKYFNIEFRDGYNGRIATGRTEEDILIYDFLSNDENGDGIPDKINFNDIDEGFLNGLLGDVLIEINLNNDGVLYGFGDLFENLPADVRSQLILKFIESKQQLYNSSDNVVDQCFLAGTMIDMWPVDVDLQLDADGNYDEKEVLANVWKKPIEQITPDDIVVSHDEDGSLKPGRVTRTMQNRAKYILDFHGLKMTPGHATFCAEGKFAGQHVPILDILRSDGCVMKADGTIIRAATNCKMGSLEDQHVWIAAGFERDGKFCATEKGRIRLGTRMILDDGHDFSLYEHYTKMFGSVDEDGFFKDGKNITEMVFHWPQGSRLPKPEDYIMQKSRVTVEDIYQHGEWERAFPPQLTAPFTGESGPSYKSDPTLHASAPPNIPLSMENSPDQPTMTRKQRRAYEAKQRKAVKAKRATKSTMQ